MEGKEYSVLSGEQKNSNLHESLLQTVEDFGKELTQKNQEKKEVQYQALKQFQANLAQLDEVIREQNQTQENSLTKFETVYRTLIERAETEFERISKSNNTFVFKDLEETREVMQGSETQFLESKAKAKTYFEENHAALLHEIKSLEDLISAKQNEQQETNLKSQNIFEEVEVNIKRQVTEDTDSLEKEYEEMKTDIAQKSANRLEVVETELKLLKVKMSEVILGLEAEQRLRQEGEDELLTVLSSYSTKILNSLTVVCNLPDTT